MSRRLAMDLVAFACLVAVIVLLPLVLSDFREFQFAYVGVYFIAALGLNILTGYAGQISLGQGGFMMIGAYTTAILSVKHGWNDLLTIPVAGIISGVVGYLFGFPALRLRGAYLALATFAIPVALISLAKRFPDITGGGGGMPLTRIVDGHEAYLITWPIALVLFAFAWFLLRGKLGRAFRTVRESEIAAVSSGINLPRTKTLAFGISAFYAGIAGSLFAIAVAFVNPDTFPISLSILLLTGVVVGGLGSLTGVFVGALFIQYIPIYSPDILDKVQGPLGLELDSKAAGAPAVVYGVLLLLTLYALPTGVAGLLGRIFHTFQRRIYSRDSAEVPGQVISARREA